MTLMLLLGEQFHVAYMRYVAFIYIGFYVHVDVILMITSKIENVAGDNGRHMVNNDGSKWR